MDLKNEDLAKRTVLLLLKNKWLIFSFVFVLTLASVVISLLLPNQYTAKVNAIPPKTSTSSMESLISGLSSTLKDIGLAKLSGKTEGMYSFLVILDSRAVKDSLINKYRFDTVYKIPKTKMTKLRKKFEENLEITLEPEGNYVIYFTDEDPNRAANVANDYVEISNYVAQKIVQTEASFNRKYLEKRISNIDTLISSILDSLQRFSQKNLIFSPEEQAKAISSSYVDLKASKISQEILYELYKSRYGENDPLTFSQRNIMESLARKLSEFENKPGYIGNFPLKSLTKVGGEYLRLYAELETYTKVKSFLLPYLEENRLNEHRQLQYLIVLDKATPPDQKSKPKRSLIVIGTFFGSFLLVTFMILLIDSISGLAREMKEFKKST
ncbi:MAG: Wzz/FepE/Etk N-terminal domain-containing protein [Ignavibacteria bacterium]|nr:Wzz/FepE/Etk N-terminal domain-containing protein [Ignavibacteria bacterium]